MPAIVSDKPCHDCARSGRDFPITVELRPLYGNIPLCNRCDEDRADRLDAAALVRRREEEATLIRARLAEAAKLTRRLRTRLRFLAPPTPREVEALRRLLGEQDETAEDRRLLRKRGWSRAMQTADGDVATGLGRSIARSVGIDYPRTEEATDASAE